MKERNRGLVRPKILKTLSVNTSALGFTLESTRVTIVQGLIDEYQTVAGADVTTPRPAASERIHFLKVFAFMATWCGREIPLTPYKKTIQHLTQNEPGSGGAGVGRTGPMCLADLSGCRDLFPAG